MSGPTQAQSQELIPGCSTPRSCEFVSVATGSAHRKREMQRSDDGRPSTSSKHYRIGRFRCRTVVSRSSNNRSESQHEPGSDGNRSLSRCDSFQWMCPPLPGQVPVEPTDISNVPTAHGAVEASPVNNSSTEKPTKRKKMKRIRSFLRNVWTAVKSPSGCCSDSKAVDVVEPFVPPLDLDSEPDSDPDHSDSLNSSVSSSDSLNSSVSSSDSLNRSLSRSDSFQEGICPPSPSQVSIEPTDISNVPTAHGAVEASPVNNSSTEKRTKGKKMKRIRSFLRNVWTAVKSPSGCCSDSKAVDVVEPFVPPLDLLSEPDSDSRQSGVEPNHDSFKSLYNAGEMIGCGGYGRVFKGTRKFDGKKVAIKRMRKTSEDLYLAIPGHPKPLIAEVAVLLMMREEPVSPYAIQLHDWFEHPRKFTLVMEYPEPCESLLDFIYDNPQLDESTARLIMRQAVLAVQHCIEHNVFYNDIHADNFLVKKDTLELKLIDFGSGQILNSDGYDSDVYIGVKFYFPPEVLTEPWFHPVPVNVWALGVLLYEMVNTCPPFQNPKEITKAKVRFQNANLSNGLDTPSSL
ncbi:developmentally-regulated protein kinase 1-like isoform X3 [Pimephales promelas]|nr:developmentally-regulated protein kinase 1-like isoform X3 [Pimephales promelas]XP_039529890.1 developmentally-regulated protein kinase 1-like isoform X3 [Pimephales promelas]XP_039529891.1 developmentally-regulated protein kinase 1-like isoform X3 [Pimephales promelas]